MNISDGALAVQQLRVVQPPAVPAADPDPLTIVIVGAGPVGRYLATKLLERDSQCRVVLFGEEPWEPYDRVRLSSYLAGDCRDVALDTTGSDSGRFEQHIGVEIKAIDRDARRVTDQLGCSHRYDRLVLATGSSAILPSIPGIALAHVYTFRNLNDAHRLKARTVRSRHTVVIGGGLLGLEAARAMRRFNTRVTVIEQAAWPMFHQLDEEIGRVLQQRVEAAGIEIITGSRVQEIAGEFSVSAIRLADGSEIPCDTVIVAAGITPSRQLAVGCDLQTHRGVLVDDHMQTSDENIFAIGECAEHRRTLYGLVNPGFEQAAVVANRLMGGDATYTGSLVATQLKVAGMPVFSIGAVNVEGMRREVTYQGDSGRFVRKLFLDGRRLDAACGIGEWEEFARLNDTVQQRRRISPLQVWRFQRTGALWKQDDDGVVSWPATATVCNCMGINRGQLTGALAEGCTDQVSLSRSTGAGTVCGSCKPLLQQLLGAVRIEPVRAAKSLAVLSVVSLVLTVLFLLPGGVAYNDSVQAPLRWDVLWTNSLAKQISGFSLLGASILLGLVFLPKRVKKVSWGDFALWRAVHVAIGALLVLALLLHTGLRMGSHLNFYLMATFVALLVAGAVIGGVVGLQHALPVTVSRQIRRYAVWAHILLLWPLPALLGFHILKTYWY